jgi:hypothetical protein
MEVVCSERAWRTPCAIAARRGARADRLAPLLLLLLLLLPLLRAAPVPSVQATTCECCGVAALRYVTWSPFYVFLRVTC